LFVIIRTFVLIVKPKMQSKCTFVIVHFAGLQYHDVIVCPCWELAPAHLRMIRSRLCPHGCILLSCGSDDTTPPVTRPQPKLGRANSLAVPSRHMG
jgi:hypothetical protein